MAQTVIGIFDTAVEAEQAIQQLVKNGFLRENIQLKSTDLRDLEREDPENEGGVSRFFKNLFSSKEEVEEDDSSEYVRLARDTKSVVTVNTESKEFAEEAATILDNCGAVNIGDKAGDIRAASAKSESLDTPSDNYETAPVTQPVVREDSRRDHGIKIPISEAYLQAGKREVLTGTALRTRVVEQTPQNARVYNDARSLSTNHADSRPFTDDDKENFRARLMEFRETKEVPVIRKEARVVEEIRLGKEVYVTTETISDTVRKTAVDVENFESKTDTVGNDYTNRQDL
jgi:hypothetical protein